MASSESESESEVGGLRYGDFLVREYRAGDEVRILEAFNRVFGGVDEGFVPRELAEWRWRFMENPAGHEIRIAVTEEGEVAGQFAAIPQRMRLEGGVGRFVQGVDNFTDARFRKSLRRDSLLSFLNNNHWDLTSGPGPDQTDVAWGLPVKAAWRVGGKLIKYELVRTQLDLHAELGELSLGAAQGIEVQEVFSFPEEVDELFERAAEPHGAIEVRSKEHLDWRFFGRPGHGYRAAVARRGGTLLGYAVYCKGAFDGRENLGLIVDWLVAPGEAGAQSALLAWLREAADQTGAEQLLALFPETVAEFQSFQGAGFRVGPTRYFPICRYFAKRRGPRWLYRHWYYTLADTDLA